CKCGRKGCLECYGSATAVVHFVKSHCTSYPDSSLNPIAQHTMTARHVYGEAKKSDPLALYVFNLIGTYLGIGIADLVNIFNPEAVILGGGLSSASQYFLPQIIHQVQKLSLEGMKENIRYMTTKHGDYTAAIGAAKYALETI
ncbi:MAG TPA: ROK family protein, partial [Spirochaetota bacterium]|nr:ROK family protein [Spirochaetota bacterium]